MNYSNQEIMNLLYKKQILFAGLFLLMLAACKKDEFNPDFDLPRQFKPGDITIRAGEVEAKLQWSPSLFTTGKNVTYTVEVSKDSLFQGPVVLTTVVDTAAAVITDSVLQVMEYYFARVKANASGTTAESGWVHSSRFRITGEQIFSALDDAQLKDTSVLLQWRPTTGLTKIVLTPSGGASTDIALTAADVANSQKLLTGLTPQTTYKAEIYRNAVIKGNITFTTKEKSIYAVILSPGDDLVAAVENAANGDIIGLQPGTYNATDATGAFVNLVITQKHLTLQSLSGNPADTKVNFKEVRLKGTGAGVTVKGIEFDGTPANADYFINFTGMNSDSEAAEFTSVLIDNSIIHNTNNSLMRGNRGSSNAHKIESIKINNSIAYANGTGSYHYLMLDKMEFKTIEITNSTIYDAARALISWATNITVPQTPEILLDKVTINSFGFSGRNNILLDANANVVNFTMQNSIIANTPKAGQSVGSSVLRAGSGSVIRFVHNNYFNLNGGDPLAPLIFPDYVQQANNLTVDLGWTNATNNFTLPADSPVRSGGTNGGPLGDPRWY